MCRWLAYSGSPIPLETVLFEPEHSLIDQSLHSRMGAETTNGAGDEELYLDTTAGSTERQGGLSRGASRDRSIARGL